MDAGPSKRRQSALPPLSKIKGPSAVSTAAASGATPGTASTTGIGGKGKERKSYTNLKKGLSPLGSERSAVVLDSRAQSQRQSLANLLEDDPAADKKKKKNKLKKSSPKSSNSIEPSTEDGGKKKKTVPISEGSAPAQPAAGPDGNMPQLWIRTDGGIKVLNNAPAAAAPSAAEPGVRIKAKKNLKGIPKTEGELWAAYEKQQTEEKAIQEEKEKKKASKQRKAAAAAASTMEDVLASIPMSGVKITLEQTAEPIKIKEEEINRTLLAQSLQTEKDNIKREMLLAAATAAAKPKVEKKKVKLHKPKAAHHSWYITRDTYLFHLHQPNLMSPLYRLPTERHMLFGQYESALERNEAKVWERPLFRPLENVFLPEVAGRTTVDLSLP